MPDGTKRCGLFACENCDSRFLSLSLSPRMVCPYCGEEVDMEVGPDEPMPVPREDAVLQMVVEGDDVEMYDQLLSLAITGGDDSWI